MSSCRRRAGLLADRPDHRQAIGHAPVDDVELRKHVVEPPHGHRVVALDGQLACLGEQSSGLGEVAGVVLDQRQHVEPGSPQVLALRAGGGGLDLVEHAPSHVTAAGEAFALAPSDAQHVQQTLGRPEGISDPERQLPRPVRNLGGLDVAVDVRGGNRVPQQDLDLLGVRK